MRPALTDSDFVWGVTARGRSSLTLDGILTDRSFILEADEISSALKKQSLLKQIWQECNATNLSIS